MSDVKKSKQETKAVKDKTIKENVTAKASKKPAKENKNVKELPVSKGLNRLLWSLVWILLIAVIGGNLYYTQHVIVEESSLARLARVGIVIGVIALALGIALFTNKGRALISFARESYVELRKVVWPTRPQAVQTTVIVFIAVSVVSLFLYLCDVVFLQIVRAITL